MSEVFVVWCASGCEPSIFSTKEKAEKYVGDDTHWNISTVAIDQDCE